MILGQMCPARGWKLNGTVQGPQRSELKPSSSPAPLTLIKSFYRSAPEHSLLEGDDNSTRMAMRIQEDHVRIPTSTCLSATVSKSTVHKRTSGQARGYGAGVIYLHFPHDETGPQRRKVTCPRPLGKLEEAVDLESVFPTYLRHQEREVRVRTATAQNGHGTDLGLDMYFLSHRAL